MSVLSACRFCKEAKCVTAFGGVVIFPLLFFFFFVVFICSLKLRLKCLRILVSLLRRHGIVVGMDNKFPEQQCPWSVFFYFFHFLKLSPFYFDFGSFFSYYCLSFHHYKLDRRHARTMCPLAKLIA